MKKIIYRLIFAVIPALPVWIILNDFWVGLFVAFLAYIIIHFIQFLAWTKIDTIYEYFTQYFVDSETGKKIDGKKLRQIIDADPVYKENLKKVISKYI